ncbi:Uncharacterised protein [Vibrio cholerae]|nr:Uncharacterised protein [Vibrio cholerae]
MALGRHRQISSTAVNPVPALKCAGLGRSLSDHHVFPPALSSWLAG